MVKNTFSQRLRGSSESALPQDIIVILLSDQRLQFVVADHLGQPHLIKEYKDDAGRKGTDIIQSVFSADADIRKTYSNSNLVLLKPAALLEPLSLRPDDSDLTKYFMSSSKDDLLSDRIEALGVKVIYSYPESAKLKVAQMFPNLRIHHHHTLHIQLFQRYVEHLPGSRVFTHVDGDSLSVFYFKEARLQYANQFPYQSAEDQIYYIMMVYQQFELDPSSVVLSVSADNRFSTNLISQLAPYIQDVQMMEYIPNMAASESIHRDTSTYQNHYFALSSIAILTSK